MNIRKKGEEKLEYDKNINDEMKEGKKNKVIKIQNNERRNTLKQNMRKKVY